MIDIISRTAEAFKNIYSPATIIYCLIIITWMVAAANRIVNKHIRWHLVAIGAFLLMLFIVRLCRYSIFMQSSMGKNWYVPVIPSAAAFVLIVIYYAVGGAPMAAWVKLYNIQEV